MGKVKAGISSVLRIPVPSLPFSIDDMLDRYSRQSSAVFYLQIGACDGVQSDPINKFIRRDGWTGISVEPVKYLYDQLVANYKGVDNLIFENAAITDTDTTKDFYYIHDPNGALPAWKKGLGSFNPHSIPLEDQKYMVKDQISCLTVTSLLDKHDVKEVNLLLIDTEGYDYEVLKLIDFNRIRPDILIYEWCTLNLHDHNESIRLLRSHGYSVYKKETDMIGLRDTTDQLLKSSLK